VLSIAVRVLPLENATFGSQPRGPRLLEIDARDRRTEAVSEAEIPSRPIERRVEVGDLGLRGHVFSYGRPGSAVLSRPD